MTGPPRSRGPTADGPRAGGPTDSLAGGSAAGQAAGPTGELADALAGGIRAVDPADLRAAGPRGERADSPTGAQAEGFFARGWVAFAPDAAQGGWAAAVLPLAEALLADPAARAAWLRCGGTWFAGVGLLPNDARGAVEHAGVPPLAGAAVAFVREALRLDGFAWDRAQLSICLPGYPRADPGETAATAAYRRDRDAAHVDGLLMRDGPGRRRYVGEAHGFVLGLPLNPAPPEAAAMVVYEGSHTIMRAAFAERLAGIAPGDWAGEDITDAYVAARRRCFAECARVPVHVPPGGAYVLHRLALHGVAPWADPWPDGLAPPAHRAIAYLRPDPRPGEAPDWWLAAP